LSGGLSVGCGAGCMGLHSVGCCGWYIDAVAYLSGLCSGFESCVGLWVCSDGVCSGAASQCVWLCSTCVTWWPNNLEYALDFHLCALPTIPIECFHAGLMTLN
jgi:hypothetical protein